MAKSGLASFLGGKLGLAEVELFRLLLPLSLKKYNFHFTRSQIILSLIKFIQNSIIYITK